MTQWFDIAHHASKIQLKDCTKYLLAFAAFILNFISIGSQCVFVNWTAPFTDRCRRVRLIREKEKVCMVTPAFEGVGGGVLIVLYQWFTGSMGLHGLHKLIGGFKLGSLWKMMNDACNTHGSIPALPHLLSSIQFKHCEYSHCTEFWSGSRGFNAQKNLKVLLQALWKLCNTLFYSFFWIVFILGFQS